MGKGGTLKEELQNKKGEKARENLLERRKE